MADTQTQTEPTDDMVIAFMAEFGKWSSVLRYRGIDKWHATDIAGVRHGLREALASQSAEIERLKGEYVHQDLLFDAQDKLSAAEARAETAEQKVKEAVEALDRAEKATSDYCWEWEKSLARALKAESALLASQSAEIERLKAEFHRRGVKIIEMTEQIGAQMVRAEAAEAKLEEARKALEVSLATMKKVNREAAPASRCSYEIDQEIHQAVFDAIKIVESALLSPEAKEKGNG